MKLTSDLSDNPKGELCLMCRYFVQTDLKLPSVTKGEPNYRAGICRRFPEFQTRRTIDWCGEFRMVPYPEQRYSSKVEHEP
jgi:hypothetical protein